MTITILLLTPIVLSETANIITKKNEEKRIFFSPMQIVFVPSGATAPS